MKTAAHLFTSEKLLDILFLSQNATAVYTGEDIIIQTANDVMIHYWGKTRDVIGLPLETAVPELKGQPFLGLLQNVWRTGNSYEASETAADLLIDGKIKTFYFDFLYRAVKDENGKVDCILHTATDVTERVAGRELVEAAMAQKIVLDTEQTLNEQLISSNEDLRLAQTSLNMLNEELEERVQSRTKALTESERRLRSLMTHAPVAIGVLTGRELFIESANAKILQVWGKTAAIVGQRLAEALPELQGQPFLQLLDDVFTTGQPCYSDEAKALLEHEGVLKTYYFNFLYQPILNEAGVTESIFIVATDLTEQVKTRQEVEQSEEMQRFTIEAAGVGTWQFYPDSNELTLSSRFKEIFGFKEDEEISFERVLSKIPQDERQGIEQAITNAVTGGIKYNVEHPVDGFED
ncbi:MAG: PAS domain-containing protein, partial [Chitinophagaceae bacterium]